MWTLGSVKMNREGAMIVSVVVQVVWNGKVFDDTSGTSRMKLLGSV